MRSREALETAIAYVEAESVSSQVSARAKSIRVGEGRAVSILACVRDAGGRMTQREFEETCLRNCRTLVGAGGFIARGSIIRQEDGGGGIEYILTEKGIETVARWESRYGSDWFASMENPNVLGNVEIHDNQKIGLAAKK